MTQEDATVTLDELRARIDRAEKEASRLTNGRDRSFRMTIPVDPDRDSDILLFDGLNAGREAIDRLSRDALSVEGREAQIAAIDAALRAVDQRIVAAYPETAVELLPGDEQGRHDYAAALYDAGVRFQPSETLA